MRIILLMTGLIAFNTFQLFGQVRAEAYAPSFFVDIDAGEGILRQQVAAVPITQNYPHSIDPYPGHIGFSSGSSSLADIQLGYYINRKRTLGISIGIMVNKQSSTLGLDSLHAEFEATDKYGQVFRQLISTDHPIAESVNMYSINIPILLQYKKDLSGRLSFTANGGLVFNTQLQNTWSTNANFRYEAVYDFTASGNTVYDNGVTAGGTEWPVTESNFLKYNSADNLNTYFATKNAAGYSVGLNESPKNGSGSFKLTSGTLGYTAAAALNFRITGKIYFRIGAYYLSETFHNTAANNSLPLTDKIIRNSAGQDTGVDYNSLVNAAKSIQNTSYGITAGVKIYLSRHSLLDY